MGYFKTLDGCSLYYETIGFESPGPVVIFLNGTMQTTMYWKNIANRLKPGFRSLLYDARGQGESDLGNLPLSLDLHLSDLQALLRNLKISRSSLVGLSHGAHLAYAATLKFPAFFGKIMMLGAGAGSTVRGRMIVKSWVEILKQGNLEAMVWATIPNVLGQPFLRKNEKMLDRMVKAIVRRNKAKSLLAHLKALDNYKPISKSLKKLDIPLLVITGDEDPLVTVEGAKEIARKSGGRHMVFKGVGHSIAIEAPDLFIKTLQEFFLE